MELIASGNDSALGVSPTILTSRFNTTSSGQLSSATSQDGDGGLPIPGQMGAMMSVATMHVIENVVHVGILPGVVLIGVTFNIINMAVFLRQGLSDGVNLCIFSLAVCDTGFMTANMAYRIHSILAFVSPLLGFYWKLRCIFFISIYVGFYNLANCLTLLISVERLICVMWPMKAKTLLTVGKIKILIVLFAVLTFSCTLVNNLSYHFQSYLDPLTNGTRYRLMPTQFYIKYQHILEMICENFNIFFPTMALVITSTNTIMIAVRIHTALAWRQAISSVGGDTSSSKERREVSVTKMLVVVCLIYSVCTVPMVMQAMARYIVFDFRVTGRLRNTWHATHAIVHVFTCVNSSVNFLVYYTMSTRFRDTLHQLLSRRKSSKLVSVQLPAQ